MALWPAGESDRQAVISLARELRTTPENLAALIAFETAGSWSPMIGNPRSSAKGLLQFLDATARGMGFDSSIDLVTKYPTVAGQLAGPVRSYLLPMAPFPTLQSLAMAVFYPVARNWPSSQQFPANVQRANPGIKTVSDYLDRVRKLGGGNLFEASPQVSLLLIALGLVLAALVVMRRV